MKCLDLRNRSGDMIGCLDLVAVQQGRLTVEGWCFAEKVGLICGPQIDEQEPSLLRLDVEDIYAGSGCPTPGFQLDVMLDVGHKAFWAEVDGESYIFALNALDHSFQRKAYLKHFPLFLMAGMRALPAATRWYLWRDSVQRKKIKDTIGLDPVVRVQHINAELFETTSQEVDQVPDMAEPTGEITIVLPVYNAFDLLPDVLARVLDHTDLPFRLLIIEDRSTDPAVRPYLRDWHESLARDVATRIEILENPENLGFIRSVNRAFERAIEFGNHVVLLNSDAFVPKGWASRLVAPFLHYDNAATVTPMSNDAEIFNVPVICQRSDLSPGVADLIDLTAQTFNGDNLLAEAPTGVGFCMAMNIEYLRLEPKLDTIFGQGYGEEVDWCRRIAARGGLNLGHAGVFVEHRGGASFGSETKLKLVQTNNGVISNRYQNYDQLVQDFITNDPLTGQRLALAMSWASAEAIQNVTGPVPVYLGHDLGGGASHYLDQRIADDLEKRAAVIVLRVGGIHHWQIEVHCAGGVIHGQTSDLSVMQKMMALLQKKYVVYSCGVGGRNALKLPETLCDLASGSDDRLEVLMHDFFPVSPSYTLLDHDGVYRGVPSEDTQNSAHRTKVGKGEIRSLKEWRSAWGRLIYQADNVTVFSQSSAEIIKKSYPDLGRSLRVIPHQLQYSITRAPSKRDLGTLPVIGVLGNIGKHKGAKVLCDLSEYLAQEKCANLVVVGNFDPAYTLSSSAQVHGTYSVTDIPDLIAKYGITDWLIPSVWPETFSYTTHEAIATGLPVWSFDLGAQGEAVGAHAARQGQGGLIPYQNGQPDIIKMVGLILQNSLENHYEQNISSN